MEFLYILEGFRVPGLNEFMLAITTLGEETALLVIALIFFWCVDKRRGYYLLFTCFTGTICIQVLKMIFRIPRPWVLDPNFTIVESAREAATGYSFPSGHTQCAAGLWGGIARSAKKRAVQIGGVALVLLVGLSRMYLGVHTPLDVGFSLLFLGLSLMKNSVPNLSETPEVLSFIQGWQGYGFGSVLIFLVFGTILTLVLQSSSATMALTLIMLNMGWIKFDMACAMVLGENIGTTITANIAAAVGNTSARRSALAHTVFNLFGVVWALVTYTYFLKLVGWVTSTIFGLPNPASPDFAVNVEYDANGVVVQSDAQTASLYGLSMLHTLFNTINTFVLIWFVPMIEKIVCYVIKGSKKAEEEEHTLKYIKAGPIATPELALGQSMNEIIHFAQISKKGLGYAKQAITEIDVEKFETLRAKLAKYEDISDKIEIEIASFLNSVSSGDISEETSNKIKGMYKIIGEIESLGDSGDSISRILSRRNAHKKSFDTETISKLLAMVALVDEAYDVMISNLVSANEGTLVAISNAYNVEDKINALRNDLRELEIDEIENNIKSYQNSVYYIDIVNELEKMGDYMINVSQELERAFSKK